MADYPEHEKLQAISGHSQKIGEFLEWLRAEKGAFLAHDLEWEDEEPTIGSLGLEPEHPRYESVKILRGAIFGYSYSVTDLLAEFFGIDQEKVEQEKRAMLDACRAMSEGP